MYRKLKTELRREEYLDYCNWKRRWLTKFRGSNSDLRVEIGRWQNLPRQERTCRICIQNVVEDEEHALLICNGYERERRELFEQIYRRTEKKLDVRIMKDNTDWMLQVLIGPGIFDVETRKVITVAVSSFLYKSMRIREALCQNMGEEEKGFRAQ